jgi:GMP synthase PP-ATPase subunit
MNKKEIVRQASDIAKKYNLLAELEIRVKSIGVQGDNRTVTPVIILSGPFPGYEKLEEVSTTITNSLPINRVIYDISPKVKKRKI